MPIIAPVYREIEEQLNMEIYRDLQKNFPTIVWLYNFPSLNMNHVVVVIAAVLWVAYALGFMNYRCIEGMRVFHT